jgi:hypothetical protein
MLTIRQLTLKQTSRLAVKKRQGWGVTVVSGHLKNLQLLSGYPSRKSQDNIHSHNRYLEGTCKYISAKKGLGWVTKPLLDLCQYLGHKKVKSASELHPFMDGPVSREISQEKEHS